MNRAVITGVGLVTPIGRTLDEVFDAMCTRRSGLVSPPEGHAVSGCVDVCAPAADIDATTVMPAD